MQYAGSMKYGIHSAHCGLYTFSIAKIAVHDLHLSSRARAKFCEVHMSPRQNEAANAGKVGTRQLRNAI